MASIDVDSCIIMQEEFLEDINCILNSGEVPGLFDNEEMDSIIMEVKQLASDQGVPDNRIAVFQFFIEVSADIDSFSCSLIDVCNNSKVFFAVSHCVRFSPGG